MFMYEIKVESRETTFFYHVIRTQNAHCGGYLNCGTIKIAHSF